MMNDITFTPALDHPPGTVYTLLKAAWLPLWNPSLAANIRQYDTEVYGSPDTVGACCLVSCLAAEPVGMVSYDPRPEPACALVGWNCVRPEYQKRGIGKRQVQRVLDIFRDRGVALAKVDTTNEDFFIPAQRMYEACGFRRVRLGRDNNIYYELALEKE